MRVEVNGKMTNVKVNELTGVVRCHATFGKGNYVVHGMIFKTWAEVGHYLLKHINDDLIHDPEKMIDTERLRNATDTLGRRCFRIVD